MVLEAPRRRWQAGDAPIRARAGFAGLFRSIGAAGPIAPMAGPFGHCDQARQGSGKAAGGLYAAADTGSGLRTPSRGSETQTTVPVPSRERSRIEPPCRLVSDLAIARPRPEP
jgi:hypothetical protein